MNEAKREDGGPAFPVSWEEPDDMLNGVRGGLVAYPGMTLRDYFAAKAMQGMWATSAPLYEDDGTALPVPTASADIARLAYEQADAMLLAKSRHPSPGEKR